jgi:hypothetical protein
MSEGAATWVRRRRLMICRMWLGQLFLGLGEAQIGGHVAAARRHRHFGFSLLDHYS